MTSTQGAELKRLNAEIVGYLLAQRSPPRELIARRERLRADEAEFAYGRRGPERAIPRDR